MNPKELAPRVIAKSKQLVWSCVVRPETRNTKILAAYGLAAKKAAKRGPVFITDRGRPSHVLLTVEEYERLTGGQKNIAEVVEGHATAAILKHLSWCGARLLTFLRSDFQHRTAPR